MRLKNYKFHFLAFLVGFFTLTRFSVDADLGWHIAYGKEFLKSGAIIASDPFSWSMHGHFWANSYFAYQIVVAWLFEHAGYLITVFIFGLLASISTVLLLPKRLNVWSFAVAVLGVLMASANLGLRPHIIDFFMFAILLILLEGGYHLRPKLAPLWFLFFAIWANFHLGFLIGLLTFWAFSIVDIIKSKKLPKAGSFLLLLSTFFGTLLTPFGLNIYKAIFFDSTSSSGVLYVYEWQPIIFSLKLMLLFVLSALVFIQIFRKNVQKIEPEWLLFGAVLFMLPFLGSFYLIFWSAYFIYVGTRYFVLKNYFLKVLVLLIAVVVILQVTFNFGKEIWRSGSLNKRFVVDGYPSGAMNFIVSHGYTERLFNHFNWGGYIDWEYPNVAVFIDGRMNGWRQLGGHYIFDDFIQIVRGNCDSFSRYQPRVALLTPGSSEKCFSGWSKVYSDKTSKVLVSPDYLH